MKGCPAGPSTLTYRELLENLDSELHTPLEGRYLGCFDDNGTLIGSLMMMDFAFNVRSVMRPMGAVAYVSTNFLHKKEKIACTLLKVLINYYAETDTPSAACIRSTRHFTGRWATATATRISCICPSPAASALLVTNPASPI